MDPKKRLYIGDFLAEGSSKAVFKVDANIRPGGDYAIRTPGNNFVLTQEILSKIYIDVPPEIDSKDIVVSRIEYDGYIDYHKNIDGLNMHLLFGRSGYAPKIYGIVTSIEPNPKAANRLKGIGYSRVEGYPKPFTGLKKSFSQEIFTNNFVTMYIFQEKCIADLKTQIEHIYKKIKSASRINPKIIEKALNEMIDDRIVKYLDDSVDTYVDKISAIELDYKPGNICLQKIDDSALTTPDSTTATAAATPAVVPKQINYKWTSFDFDVKFTRGYKQIIQTDQLPEEIKTDFKKYAKLFMKINFFITLTYSFRVYDSSSPEEFQLYAAITPILAKKINEIYGINYEIILKTIVFFVSFNMFYNPIFKVFFGSQRPGQPYMSNTPEFMLRFYAEQYFTHYDKITRTYITNIPVGPIEDAYNDNTKPVERDAKIICGILGLDFPSSPVVRAMSSASAIPFIKNPFASGQMSLLPSPPNPDEMLLPPPNPDEMPIGSPITSPSKRLQRQDSNNEQDGGRKRKNTKSKKNKKHKHRKSHKRAHSRK